jgi:hypothetical protein
VSFQDRRTGSLSKLGAQVHLNGLAERTDDRANSHCRSLKMTSRLCSLSAHSPSEQIPGRTARRVRVRRRRRRTLCRVRSPRRRIHSGSCQHAMAVARVRGEGLRWASAGFRREPVVFSGRPFQKTDLANEWLGIGFLESLHLVCGPITRHP